MAHEKGRWGSATTPPVSSMRQVLHRAALLSTWFGGEDTGKEPEVVG